MTLKPEDVRHLVFEGGGGKGNAFLGAVKALESLGVLRPGSRPPLASSPITSIGGASAGAITAMLVGTGMSAAELYTEMDRTDFREWFDRPAGDRLASRAPGRAGGRRPRHIGAAPGSTNPLRGTTRREHVRTFGKSLKTLGEVCGDDVVRTAAQVVPGLGLLWSAFVNYEEELSEWLAKKTEGATGAPYGQVLKKMRVPVQRPPPGELFRALGELAERDLSTYWGVFKGDKALQWIEERLSERLTQSGLAVKDATFSAYRARLGIRLVISGTNLATAKSEIFSPETTPNMPVSIAVRISMGLPIIYHPVVIDPDMARQFART